MSTALNTSIAPQGQATETFAIDADHSDVGFSVRHMLSRTRGRFARFSGAIQLDREQPEHSSVAFEVDPASIDTRQPDRDTHLRSGDFFDVERFPLIRFTSQRVSKLAADKYRVEGTLELRGILKPMVLEVGYHGVAKDPWGNERAGFSTEAVINRKEFGMVWNAALDNGGVILGDDVTLTIDLETVRKS
ncbi:MAG TPA: YceI family protein [Methylomirabilota bacterium]|jgi:polyisoprenoid-binding protein YceI|nr:YceI family protein [Methylomirabilota bacterium]